MLEVMDFVGDGDLIFVNFIDFDFFYGYWCDVFGYVVVLEYFDWWLLEMIGKLVDGDLFILIVDYGCDLIWKGMDYICEYVLVIGIG